MKDGDLLTLKAFIAAYEANDRPPIPELAEIRANLDQRVKELHKIACNHAQLRDDYEKARVLLTSAAGERKAGLYVVACTSIPPFGNGGDDGKEVENLLRVLDQKSKEELGLELQPPEP